MKILVTPTSMQPGKRSAALAALRAFAEANSYELVFNGTGRPLTEDELIPMLEGWVGYLAGLDHITDKVIGSCPGLKVISRYGVGYERVDTASAKVHGVTVTNTPGANSEAVGELAMGLIIAAARKIPSLDRSTRSGGWLRSTGTELLGKKIGILGLGAIGRVTARCAMGFGMEVMAYDPYIDSDYCRCHGIEVKTFDEIISEADVISLHLPLTDETRHVISGDAFRAMKDGVILVNTSRGGIIDEDAALEALESGRIAGLCLDAFENEPPEDSPLFAYEQVIVTPHTGAHTKEATDGMADMAVRNLIAVLEGRECPYIV